MSTSAQQRTVEKDDEFLGRPLSWIAHLLSLMAGSILIGLHFDSALLSTGIFWLVSSIVYGIMYAFERDRKIRSSYEDNSRD